MYDRLLLTFIEVADTGSFSQAAERLFITPAAVMKQMNVLEERLGVTLIERSNHGIALTEAGRYIYAESGKLIAASNSIIERARDIQRRSGKVIRIGSSFLNPGQVLVDLWNQISSEPGRFSPKLVPYTDDREQILSVVASLGSKIDFMAGVLGSQTMLEMADFYELWRCPLCVAVPRMHYLASRSGLEMSDLAGEKLVMCRRGDAPYLELLRSDLQQKCPQIILIDTDFFYDLDTFNYCELTGSLLLSFEMWSGVHPGLVTVPVNWEYTAPYGLLHSKNISGAARDFLDILKAGKRD